MADAVNVEDLRPGDTVQTTATVVAVVIDANGVSVQWDIAEPIPAHFSPVGTVIADVTRAPVVAAPGG